MSDTPQAQAEDRRAKALAREIFDLESTGGMDDLAFLEGRARAVIEMEFSRLARVEQALRDLLEAIDSLLTDELRERFGPYEERPKGSRIFSLLVVPRNMARDALSASPSSQPKER